MLYGARQYPPFVSLPVRGAWIEMALKVRRKCIGMSLPVRGAWIEIVVYTIIPLLRQVAPRAGSVD